MPYAKAIETPPKKLKIALCTRSWSGYPIYPEVLAAAKEAGLRLQSLGHDVTEAGPDFDYAPYLEAQKVNKTTNTTQTQDELAGFLGRRVDESQLQSTTIASYQY